MKNTKEEYKKTIEFENKILKNALNQIISHQIISPIKFMRDNLKEGERLNGYAFQLSNDANYLKEIAYEALKSLIPNPPQK